MVLTDERRALLGDHEAAKRLTDAGVLLPCWRCGGQARIEDWACGYENGTTIECMTCHAVVCEGIEDGNGWHERAIQAWNTRAAILSAEEMEMLEGMKNG